MPTTLPLAEPDAANFLIVGTDVGECLADDPAVGPRDRPKLADTIMVWRVKPDTNQIAVLSFPRDLYVQLPGGRKSRINEAYRTGPQGIVDTLWANFGVPVDHLIEVDLCAFVALIDAVGGVEVPFATPARDPNVGFDVPAGCVTLDGDSALRYVRTRHYQWQDDDGNWHLDPTSDFGRISRQQDFLRRVIGKIIDDGLYRPDTVLALLDANREYVVTDDELTPRRMQEFANTLRRVEPAAIGTYRIESRTKWVGDASMEEPLTNGENMQTILAVFRGHATLASAPDQVLGTVPTTLAETPSTSATPSDEMTVPIVTAESNNVGRSPDPAASC